jgi:hypothetical protein
MDKPQDERLFALCSTLVSEGLAFLGRYLEGKHYVRRIEDLPSVEWSDDGMPQFRFFGNEKPDYKSAFDNWWGLASKALAREGHEPYEPPVFEFDKLPAFQALKTYVGSTSALVGKFFPPGDATEKYDLFATSLKLFIEMSIDRYVHIFGLTSFEPENYLRVYLPLESGLLKDRSACGRKRLLVGAVSHADLVEDCFAHELREGLAGDIHDELLLDRDTAAGVAELCAGDEIHTDGRGVGGWLTVEDLHQRWDRCANFIARESVDGEAGTVAQDAAQRDFLVLVEFVIWNLPGLEFQVHIFVERERSMLHQEECARCGHGLADRPCLEKSVNRHRRIATGFRDSVAFRPGDLEIIDDGDAEAGTLIELHQLVDVQWRGGFGVAERNRWNAVFHALHAARKIRGLSVVLRFGLRGGGDD